jgi:hypothetical protein
MFRLAKLLNVLNNGRAQYAFPATWDPMELPRISTELQNQGSLF